MSDGDREIMARISQLAGQINRHKNQQAGSGSTLNNHRPHHHANTYQRGSFHSRGYRVGRGTTHRHRTLVLNNGGTHTPTSTASDGSATPEPAASWVSKTDRHLQLINSAVYEKESQNRTKAIEETRKQKLRQRDAAERAKLMGFVAHQARASSATASSSTGAPGAGRYELDIDGVRFVVAKNGSKLVKVSGDVGGSTPKTAIVGGVKFYRSKNGNLYRDGIVRAHRKLSTVKKVNMPCKAFSTTGSCSKGPLCRYLHNPERVAACKDFLLKGTCNNGEDCDLSHDLSPTRTPTCLHYLKGNCTNPSCRYAHSSVSPGAPVCRDFGIYGFCEKGLECPDRHAFECPDFSNTGTCKTKGCKLLHRERASVLRKAAPREAGAVDAEMGDLSSDDESVDSNDVDSDEVDEFIGQVDGDASDFEGQKDFIAF